MDYIKRFIGTFCILTVTACGGKSEIITSFDIELIRGNWYRLCYQSQTPNVYMLEQRFFLTSGRYLFGVASFSDPACVGTSILSSDVYAGAYRLGETRLSQEGVLAQRIILTDAGDAIPNYPSDLYYYRINDTAYFTDFVEGDAPSFNFSQVFVFP